MDGCGHFREIWLKSHGKIVQVLNFEIIEY